jgi:hypothetical protein
VINCSGILKSVRDGDWLRLDCHLGRVTVGACSGQRVGA